MNTASRRILTTSIAALAAAAVFQKETHAASGTWGVDNGTNWSTAASWTGSTIADGAGFTASFVFNITAARTVTLDTARTIGNLTFTDATTASHDWTLAGAQTLTLDVTTGTSTINVTNRTATINTVLAGNDGVTTTGAGTLVLGGNNTWTGGLIISGASLTRLAHNNAAGANAISFAAASTGRLIVTGGVTIANTINIGAGITNVAGRGLIEASDTNGQATVNGPINITAGPTNGGILRGGLTVGNELVLGGIITSSVQLTQRDGRVIYRGGGTGYTSMGITGTALVGANNGISTTAIPVVALSGAGTLDLQNFNQALAGVTFAATATATVTGGTGVLTLNGPVGSSGNFTHIFNGNVDLNGGSRTFTVGDGTNVVDLLAGAAFTNGTITKAGAGTLNLNGTSSASAHVSVTGGTLGGTGTLNGSVTLGNTTVLRPGTVSSTGTFTTNALNFAAGSTDVHLKIGAGGDLINGGAVTAGGTAFLNVVQIGGILANGTYNLINYTGASPGLGGFAIGGGGVGHTTGGLIDTGSSIAYQITGNDRVVWTGGVSTAWDPASATQNWQTQTGGTPTNFILGDDVIFGDGPVASNVVISANVTPSNVLFANSLATLYNVSGGGGITGLTGVTKIGDGVVTLATQNAYAGATTIAEGALELDHDATGNLVLTGTSGVSVAAPGKLLLSRDDGGFTFDRAISGNGTVEINPHSIAGGVVAHSVVLSGNNSGFSGTLRLLSPATGTWRVTTVQPTALGTASIEVQNGAQLYTAANQTYTNSIAITGTGFVDASANLGALRLEPGSVWAGGIVVNGAARMGAHSGTATVSGGISGGALEVNVSNYNVSNTIIFTGANSYTTTVVGGVGGVTPQSTANISMRLNIGNGGTTGSLGTGAVTINADGTAGAANGTNGVLGFDRSDGYTLLAGQTITGGGGNLSRTFIDMDSLGAGFNDNGNAITLGTALTGGSIRVAQGRANAIANISGALTAQSIRVSTGQTGGVLNFQAGAVVNANQLYAGEAANMSGTINQTGGDVSVIGQMRAGHFGTETSIYNISGGTLTLTGASTVNNPSTANAGGASATGDNNIEAFVTPTIHGGGIYLGIDGQGTFNLNAGTVTTNWIVLDNRGNSGSGANMSDGIDRLNINNGTLSLRSTWGIQGRNTSAAVSFAGGTVRVDNTGTGGAAGNTGANLLVPLDADITTSGAGTTLDTNGAGNGFSLTRTMNGTAPLTLTGGGTLNFNTAAFQTITPALVSSGTGVSLTKTGIGITTLAGSGAGFTGVTNVNAGVLNVPANFASPTINVADAAALAGEPTAATVNLGTATGAVVYFDPNTSGALTAGALTMTGTTTLDFSTSPAGAGPWTAINYTTTAGALPVLANGGTYRVAPVVTDTGSAITVNVTGLKTLTWTGLANANWNNNVDANWNDGAAADVFFAGDTVIFPEGGANPAVAVASGVSPFITAVTATTTNYTLTSAGTGISGPGSLVKTGASTLVLAGTNTYRGKTIINEGTVSIASGASLGLGSLSNGVELSGGGRLMATAALDTGASRDIAVGAGGGVIAMSNAAAQTVTIPGPIAGSGALTFNSVLAGGGTFALSGANSGYIGDIAVTATSTGLTTLQLANQAAVPNAASITLNYPAAATTNGNATTLNLQAVTLPAGTALNMTAFLNGAISQRSQITSSGINTVNGPIFLTGNAGSVIQMSPANGLLTFNGNISEASPGSFGNGAQAVLFLRSAGNTTINGTINLPTALVSRVDDTGITTINSTGNVWAATDVRSSSTLRLGTHNALPVGATMVIGQTSDAGNSIFELNGFNQEIAGLGYNNGNGANNRRVTNSSTTASTLTINNAGNFTFGTVAANGAGNLTGNLHIVKNGAGTQTFAGPANTYTGNVTVNNGTLVAGGNAGSNALGNPALAGRTITVNAPATLSLTTNNVLGNGVGNNNLPAITLAGGTLSSTRYNVLGALTLSGATLTQSATDTGAYEGYQFRGDITVGGSALSTISTGNGKANHLGPVTNFIVANATGDSATDLLISAPLRNQSGDFASATGNLVKSGAGTMELTATSTYTGTTTINDGTLLVNGGITGSILTSVNAGGTLGGSGGLGALDLNGGTLAPGNSTGILTTNGSVDFGGGSFDVEINGLTAGTQYDQLAVLGLAASIVTISANTELDITLGFTPSFGDSFILVDNDGPDTVITTGLFTISGNPILDGSDFTVSGSTFQLTYAGGDGNDIELLAVPEPGSAALLLGGLALLAGSRRRKK